MKEIIGPIQGIIVGILLLYYKKKIALFLENSVKKFPKYKDGEETFKIEYNVRPIFITIIGSLLFLFSLYGLLHNLRIL